MSEHHEEYYTCKKCGRSLPVSCYQKTKNMTCGHYSDCRECRNAYGREWQRQKKRDNPDAVRKASRDYYLRAGKEKKRIRAILSDKAAEIEKRKKWYQENRVEILASRKVIPDDDPETDLVPMEAGGFVRWAVLTDERRKAHGEQSPFNGLSVARDRAME